LKYSYHSHSSFQSGFLNTHSSLRIFLSLYYFSLPAVLSAPITFFHEINFNFCPTLLTFFFGKIELYVQNEKVYLSCDTQVNIVTGTDKSK
jgi:hypothetical protein